MRLPSPEAAVEDDSALVASFSYHEEEDVFGHARLGLDAAGDSGSLQDIVGTSTVSSSAAGLKAGDPVNDDVSGGGPQVTPNPEDRSRLS